MKKSHPVVLCIAGSDSSGGAGIQADIKSITANGAYAATILTALTAQNTVGVEAIHSIPLTFITSQLDAVLSDIKVNTIKIGMLHKSNIVKKVATHLKAYPNTPIIVDPVMVAQSGDKLIENETVDSIKKYMLPQATLITPNIPEAEILSNTKIYDKQSMQAAAIKLSETYQTNTLIKGGHLTHDDAVDYLYLVKSKRFTEYSHPRINTKNNHGTGCTLSSAIAAYIARGFSLQAAIEKSKLYLNAALLKGRRYTIGKGHGPVHHYFALEEYHNV